MKITLGQDEIAKACALYILSKSKIKFESNKYKVVFTGDDKNKLEAEVDFISE